MTTDHTPTLTRRGDDVTIEHDKRAAMIDCAVCKPDPVPEHIGPGIPVRLGGTRHRADCSLIGFKPTPEQQREWNAWIDELERCRRAAHEASLTWVIG